ncbi:hypothetical protein SLEP1_g323 [Rubroshorea leprosula]|uniref:Uncharacterized protein n=1 Tax=Rubroshorea leprosula TaxID=152421 RepID=A0AAV5HIY3_9ROSI|nr:hypothetical protein SLEP1_g323 [Rubroshorea leprosula]
MDKSFINNQKDDSREEDSVDSLRNKGELSGENSINYSPIKSKGLVRRAQHGLIFNVKKLHTSNGFIKDSLLQSTCGLGNKIPRHVVTLEEKYSRHCLEQINLITEKAARSNISENFSSVKMGSLSDVVNRVKIRNEDTSDFGRFVFGCPLAAAGDGSAVIGLPGQWIVGSVMGNKGVMNILKSPLLQKLGASDAGADFRRNFKDVKGTISYDFLSSPGGLSNCSSHKPEKETYMLGKNKYQSENSHRRLISMSSTNSTCSDHSSSPSAFISQGMLQCTWKSGVPHFVFSLDNQRDVYVANLSKAESALDKGMKYLYLFHSSKHGNKEQGFCGKESHLVGKMKVSTSFSISPDNSKIMEREFVLFGDSGNFIGEMQASNNKHRKNKRQMKKFVDVFRPSHPSKQRGVSRFVGSSSNLEDCSLEPCLDIANSSDTRGGVNLLEEPLPHNLQLAAILVKDHLPENCPKEIGGWGLKFLKRVCTKPTIDSFAALEQNACEDNNGNCSTSMDVLLPAGLHGGPKTRNGGPSSLIERWRSGGHCDCGGWDLGCPLTVLKIRSTKGEASPDADVPEPCKFCDFFIQGSEHHAPALRIASIHDGLYFVHFQSTLSILQSFSIAVAYIHTHSPALRPKSVQESKQ